MKDRDHWFAQANAVGGGSTINPQIFFRRGNALDYESWSEDDECTGFSYREALPYFGRSEANEWHLDDQHGIDGQLGVSARRGALSIRDAFIRAARQSGIPHYPDFNGRRQAWIGYYQLTQSNVRRPPSATAFLSPAESRLNLKVLTGTRFDRIRIGQEHAVGAEYATNCRRVVFRAEQETIACSKAIGTPRPKMLSRIGPADHLKQVGVEGVRGLPGIGSNLRDHIDLYTASERSGRHSYDGVDCLDRMAEAGLKCMLFKSGPVTASLLEMGGCRCADSSARSSDILFHFGQGYGIEKGTARIDAAGPTLNSAFVRPRSRKTVRLRSSDPDDATLIDPHYWDEPFNREMSLKGLDMARQLTRQQALKPYIRKEVLPGPNVVDRESLFDYACRMAKTDHHPVGTCRIGSDNMAVIDPQLRVRGIEGLRICDSSIMPTIVSFNKNAATIMMGVKGSNLIPGRKSMPPAVLDEIPVQGDPRSGRSHPVEEAGDRHGI